MAVLRTLRVSALTLAVFTLLGCGSGDGKYVKVSGVVNLDGKPYGKAVVSFQPLGSKDNPNPGRGSTANTDDNGRFVLKTDEGQEGAVTGKHTVRIMTREANKAPIDMTVGSPDGDSGPITKTKSKQIRDPIPQEWFTEGKEFVVPPGGTDKANFDITSLTAGARKK